MDVTCFAQFISLNQKLTRCNCGFTYWVVWKKLPFQSCIFIFFNWNKENKHQVNVIHVYLRTVQSFRVWEMDNLAVALMQKNSFILPQIVLGFLSWLGLGMVKWFETYQFGRAPYWVGVIIFGSVRFLPLKNNQTGRQKKEK
jgi:hypothetical protein